MKRIRKRIRVGDVVVLKARDHSEFMLNVPKHTNIYFAGFVTRMNKTYYYLTMSKVDDRFFTASSAQVRVLRSAVVGKRIWRWKNRNR